MRRRVVGAITLMCAGTAALLLASHTNGARSALWLVSLLPEDRRCGHPFGQWSALAQNIADVDTTCLSDLVQGPRTEQMMLVLARDASRPEHARIRALAALAGKGGLGDDLILPLLLSASTPPAFHRDLTTALFSLPDGPRWAALAADVPAHGIDDLGILALFAADEPGLNFETARALRSAERRAGEPGSPDALSLVFRGLGIDPTDLQDTRRVGSLPRGWGVAIAQHPCTPRCTDAALALLNVAARTTSVDNPAPQPAINGDDDALVLMYRGDGEAIDAARRRLNRMTAWVNSGSPSARGDRIAWLVMHPGGTLAAPAATTIPGRPLDDVLELANGSPGATAFAAETLAIAADTPIRMWFADDTLTIATGDRLTTLSRCRGPRTTNIVPTGTPLASGSGVALMLAEAAQAALNAGDWEYAGHTGAAAARAWRGGAPVDLLVEIAAEVTGPTTPETAGPQDADRTAWKVWFGTQALRPDRALHQLDTLDPNVPLPHALARLVAKAKRAIGEPSGSAWTPAVPPSTVVPSECATAWEPYPS